MMVPLLAPWSKYFFLFLKKKLTCNGHFLKKLPLKKIQELWQKQNHERTYFYSRMHLYVCSNLCPDSLCEARSRVKRKEEEATSYPSPPIYCQVNQNSSLG